MSARTWVGSGRISQTISRGNAESLDNVPTGSIWVGRFREDYYDGTADLQLGGIVDWFDLYVGNDRTTYFEAR